MTITPSVWIFDGKWVIRGPTIIFGILDVVVSSSATSSDPIDGIILGAHFTEHSCHHVLPLGGWQSVGFNQPQEESERHNALLRLTGIKENKKFQSKEDPAAGIETIVQVAKNNYGLKYVYVWQAITGYWGGVHPGVEGMEEHGSKMQHPKISPRVAENEPWLMTDAITLQGLGLVNPRRAYKFYNKLHSYLAAAGVDGVKVDVRCILETLKAGLGGRVEFTRKYHQALDASVAKNFPDNGCIACTSHNTDALYCSKQMAVVRASDDFYSRDPVSHTIHIASVAYHSIFLSEFILPDWDTIGGGPIYVSDAPGKHNFELLRKLVLPGGSILLLVLHKAASSQTQLVMVLLKIWNMNKFTGVLGVYNCQGAAWSSTEKKNIFRHTGSDALSCAVKGSDVHLISEAAMDRDWNGDCILYRHRDGRLVVLRRNAAMPVSLKDFVPGFRFAPLGLVDMFDAGGSVDGFTYHILGGANILELDSTVAGEMNGALMSSMENRSGDAAALVCMEVKGCGRLGAYCSAEPRKCMLGSADVEFSYDPSSGFLTLQPDKHARGQQESSQSSD
ncbi:putative galactinol--sucrose galactosyltransferase 6 [Cocos nucifera]|uniref:Putative galactinol--sucrose galactosyltransferase 6 n=1 Tax=Cocos nucifera TaxID=13894 RepID=A0A8K0INC3_COCNU|nr:putative galactinol--sucrose galactosyltransferase 6 [Cocos nucifera]